MQDRTMVYVSYPFFCAIYLSLFCVVYNFVLFLSAIFFFSYNFLLFISCSLHLLLLNFLFHVHIPSPYFLLSTHLK
jgi:hypothetical protein